MLQRLVLLAAAVFVAVLATDNVITIDGANGNLGSWKGCPAGFALCGMQARFEDYSELVTDNTALNGLRMKCCNVTGVKTQDVSVTNGTYGTWKAWSMCPTGYFVTGFDLKLSEPAADYEGATALGLRCRAWGADLPADVVDVYPWEDGHGSWNGFVECPDNKFVVASAIRVDTTRKVDGDASEINGLRMNCSAVACPSISCRGTGQFAATCASGYNPTHCETCRGPCEAGSFTAKNCTPTSDRLCKVCDKCPPGKTKIGGCTQYVNTTCGPCANGTYYQPAFGLCDSCPAGAYVPRGIPAADDCMPFLCPAGTADLDASSLTPCVACSNGTYSAPGSTACAVCPAGETDHDANPATPCEPCGPGYTLARPGSVGPCAQFACPAGSVDDDASPLTPCVTCSNGTGVPAPATSGPCSAYICPLGEVDHDFRSATACLVCPPGTVANRTGLTGPCALCPAGTTDDDDDPSTACVSCRAGTNATVPGHTGPCDLCTPGQTDHDYNPRTPCYDCSAGHEHTNYGSTGPCKLCSPGTVDHDRNASTACVRCGNGTGVAGFGTTGPCADRVCAAGTTDHDFNSSTACVPCPPGADLSAPGMAGACADLLCPRGSVDHDLNPATACVQCPAGVFMSARGLTGACSRYLCPVGTTNADGNISTPCDRCQPGTQWLGTGGVGACNTSLCPVGTTDHDSNSSTACIPCPAGGYFPAGSFGTCASRKCSGGLIDGDGNSSTPCVALIDCPAGATENAAPTPTSQRTCRACLLGSTFKPEVGQGPCRAVTECLQERNMYTLFPATLELDTQCGIYSPECDVEFELEVAPATPSSDRVCKAFTEVSAYFEIDYISHGATEKSAAAFIANIHTALREQLPTYVDDAIFKIQLYRGSVRAVFFMLTESADAITTLKEALAANTLQVLDRNGVNATALAEPIDPIFDPPRGGTVAVALIVTGLGLTAVAFLIWRTVTNYQMAHYTSASSYTNPLFGQDQAANDGETPGHHSGGMGYGKVGDDEPAVIPAPTLTSSA